MIQVVANQEAVYYLMYYSLYKNDVMYNTFCIFIDRMGRYFWELCNDNERTLLRNTVVMQLEMNPNKRRVRKKTIKKLYFSSLYQPKQDSLSTKIKKL